MRALPALAALILCAALVPRPARAEDPLLLRRPDLHAHFAISYGLSLTLTEILEGPEPWSPALGEGWALVIATGAVGALGLAKEIWLDDAIDGDDLIADGLGLGLNALVQVTLGF